MLVVAASHFRLCIDDLPGCQPFFTPCRLKVATGELHTDELF
jgi:hypothetical protein